jgi:hypothetical protein
LRSVLLLATQLGPGSDDPRAPFSAGTRRLPALERVLARSRLRREPAEHAHAWLCGAFGVHAQDGEWPLAALTLLAEDIAPGAASWLRADPVNLQARDAGLMLACDDLGLRAADAVGFVEALNRHFEQEGLTFVAPAPQRWYVRLATPARLCTTPLELARGRDIAALLPRGPDALVWHRRANEAQMLLHAHPLNAAREDAGAPPVNSIWFWGGGSLPAGPAAAGAPVKVWADNVLARGLARFADRPLQPLPPDAGAWLAAASEGCHLVVLGTAPADNAELHAQIDELWLAPLLRALGRGDLRELSLLVPHPRSTLRFTLARADLWKVWRRGHALGRA